MNKYLFALIFGGAVAAGAYVVFRLLLPWFTYSRAYLFVAVMIFAGCGITFSLAWTARAGAAATSNTRARYLFRQGLGLFVVGVLWIFFSRWLLTK
jgi:hypothetical protein